MPPTPTRTPTRTPTPSATCTPIGGHPPGYTNSGGGGADNLPFRYQAVGPCNSTLPATTTPTSTATASLTATHSQSHTPTRTMTRTASTTVTRSYTPTPSPTNPSCGFTSGVGGTFAECPTPTPTPCRVILANPLPIITPLVDMYIVQMNTIYSLRNPVINGQKFAQYTAGQTLLQNGSVSIIQVGDPNTTGQEWYSFNFGTEWIVGKWNGLTISSTDRFFPQRSTVTFVTAPVPVLYVPLS